MNRRPITAAVLLLARSYIDPGTGGFIITSVLGFFTAIGYFFRTYYGRLKKLFSFGGGKPGAGSGSAGSDAAGHAASVVGSEAADEPDPAGTSEAAGDPGSASAAGEPELDAAQS